MKEYKTIKEALLDATEKTTILHLDTGIIRRYETHLKPGDTYVTSDGKEYIVKVQEDGTRYVSDDKFVGLYGFLLIFDKYYSSPKAILKYLNK